MLRNGFIIIAALASLTGPARGASAPAASTFFYTPFTASAVHRFGMHERPPVDQALVLKLEAAAQADAESTCLSLLGDFTTLEVVAVGEVRESILAYHLGVDYLCGRSVSHPALVVPSLVRAVTSASFDLQQLALPLLLATGDLGGVALLELAEAEGESLETRSEALEALGAFLSGEARGFTLHEATIRRLIELVRYTEFPELVYYAAESLAKAPQFSRILDSEFDTIGAERLGQLALASANRFDAKSPYAVNVKILAHLLATGLPSVTYYPTSALARRGYKEGDLAVLLPLLEPLTSPVAEPLVSSVFAALAAAPVEARILPLILNGIEPALLAQSEAHAFLFQAMLALRDYTALPEAHAATSALQAIARSSVNPQNPYLQNLAKELLQSLGQ